MSATGRGVRSGHARLPAPRPRVETQGAWFGSRRHARFRARGSRRYRGGPSAGCGGSGCPGCCWSRRSRPTAALGWRRHRCRRGRRSTTCSTVPAGWAGAATRPRCWARSGGRCGRCTRAVLGDGALDPTAVLVARTAALLVALDRRDGAPRPGRRGLGAGSPGPWPTRARPRARDGGAVRGRADLAEAVGLAVVALGALLVASDGEGRRRAGAGLGGDERALAGRPPAGSLGAPSPTRQVVAGSGRADAQVVEVIRPGRAGSSWTDGTSRREGGRRRGGRQPRRRRARSTTGGLG